VLIAHRIALDPNNVQATYFARASGVARFAYNWALAEWKRQYEAWKADPSLPKPSQQSLRRQLNAIKREQFPWMLEVTKCAPQMAIIQLGQAFQNFFVGRARYPQFRKKGVHDRFTLTNDQFSIDGCRIFRRQLEYKAAMRGGQVVVADRFFASSKTCSACGHKLDDLPLSVREWTCPDCGSIHDRDANAAINLKKWPRVRLAAASPFSDTLIAR
jgi:Transposase and inactivated derivatives